MEDPVVQLPADWGSVFVSGEAITPSALYEVVAECGSLTSPPGSGTTPIWGDTVGVFEDGAWLPPDGAVEILDIFAIVEGFQSAKTAPDLQRIDLWPCTPDGAIDILDVLFGVEGFQGIVYPCPGPCPP